jgi:integrase/recombinase XerD
VTGFALGSNPREELIMGELGGVRVTGPLASHVEGFCAALVRVGYAPSTAREHGAVLVHLSRWLAAERLESSQLTAPVVERFLDARRRTGYRRWRSVRSLRPLLEYLREVADVPASAPPAAEGPVDRLLDAYRRYLRVERRLAPTTVRIHEDVARRFLLPHADDDRLDLDGLGPAQVRAFVLAEVQMRSVGSMKALLSPLRALLRFLFVAGLVPRDLTAAVPAVASPRLASLPRALDSATVAALLSSCDRRTAIGRRDFAVLVVMVRLGLRAGEVAALQLDDVGWRSGELVVHGKGSRLDRLPLPVDVGEAVVDYLRHGRPRSACRSLFLRACAPDGPMSGRSVAMVPRSASRRAGLPAAVGAHRLRHTAASEMLRGGASLAEVAEVLRHRSESTTAIYAKIDRASLDLLVRPWPGAGR